ncbi:MAG: type I polyketide synthase, partial [Chitinophagaceae bacterium]
MLPMPAAEGMRAFEVLLSQASGQAIVAYGKRSHINAALMGDRKDELMQEQEDALMDAQPEAIISSSSSTSHTGTDTTKLKAVALDHLVRVLSTELKLGKEKLDTTVALQEYGINSIAITRMTNELDKLFDKIPRTLFFEYQTLEQLTEYFASEHADKLQQMAPLSQEEAPIVAKDAVQAEKKNKGAQRFLTGQSLSPRLHLPVRSFDREEIAVIGLSGRYPGAKNIAAFWENLKAGKDSISEIPADRWAIHGFYDEEKGKEGKSYSKWGGFIPDVDKFDALFFNITPREAELMDPQERLFLQAAWEAIEDAGYTRAQLQGTEMKGDTGAK